jgi:hypothetical protein
MIDARLPTDEEGNSIDVPKNQAVMELTMDVWAVSRGCFGAFRD